MLCVTAHHSIIEFPIKNIHARIGDLTAGTILLSSVLTSSFDVVHNCPFQGLVQVHLHFNWSAKPEHRLIKAIADPYTVHQFRYMDFLSLNNFKEIYSGPLTIILPIRRLKQENPFLNSLYNFLEPAQHIANCLIWYIYCSSEALSWFSCEFSIKNSLILPIVSHVVGYFPGEIRGQAEAYSWSTQINTIRTWLLTFYILYITEDNFYWPQSIPGESLGS